MTKKFLFISSSFGLGHVVRVFIFVDHYNSRGLMIGENISHYRILEKLGGGGQVRRALTLYLLKN